MRPGWLRVSGYLWLSLGVLSGLLLAGCDQPPEEGKAEVGWIAPSRQVPGDAQRGHDLLVNHSLEECGLPLEAYRTLARGGSAGPQFPGRSPENAGLPYSLVREVSASGVAVVTPNCMVCHAAPVNGELIMGLGNEFLDLTQDPVAVAAAAESHVPAGAARQEWRRWSERVVSVADAMVTDTVGVNSADHLALTRMAHLDAQTLRWRERPWTDLPGGKALPVSVPPLWNLHQKHALFYNGMGRGDQVPYLYAGAVLCGADRQNVESALQWLADVRAYLVTLRAPAYPYAIDRVLASRGATLYQAECASCHGRDDVPDRFPNRIIALGSVGTDPQLARLGYSGMDPFLDWLRQAFPDRAIRPAPALGYLAPPLDGIWATAPYLHNGSVPTLAALLDARLRPTCWSMARSDAQALPAYDSAQVGWSWRALSHGKAGAMSWEERSHIYDTTLPGYGNRGHLYGSRLSPHERRALLEYLKTL